MESNKTRKKGKNAVVTEEPRLVLEFGHWLLPEGVDKTSLSLPFGFIYMITNTKTGKKYIGKKQCVANRRVVRKNKRCRRATFETDWKTYTSSSRELNEDIATYGKEHFKFEILRFCDNKSQLAYYEAKLQFENDVLLRDDFYNGIINLRVGKIKV